MYKTIEIPCSGGAISRIMVGNVIDQLENVVPQGTRMIIITDSNIHRIYGDLINRYEHIVIGLGESSKTIRTAESLWRQLLEMGVDRKSFIVGVGGGIVTDVTGFVASTFMRGVRFGFVSTTLLGQVDASVGGKNGVNLDGFKNIVGVFNQPEFVLCDIGMLSSLPVRELRAGMAEIIKGGILGDARLFEMFEQHSFEEFQSNGELLGEAIERSIKLKAKIVEQDERERGCRKLLNLGHTVAHAIEKCGDEFLHGEAVAIGLVYATRMSVERGLLSESEAQRIYSVIERMGLPMSCSHRGSQLYKALLSDKKKNLHSIEFILIEAVGKAIIVPHSIEELEQIICTLSE